MTRAVLIQLALFLAIAVGCGVFVLNTVFGSQPVKPLDRVAVRMPDAGGLTPGSQVTYRGVSVGTVSAVAIDADGQGVRLDLRVDTDRRIPAASDAKVSMDAPMPIKHLDLQPAGDGPPYLHDGSVIGPQRTSRPLPLESLLVDFDRATGTINSGDVSRVSQALATGLNGEGPQLRRIVDNTDVLTRLLQQHDPQVTDLLGQGPGALGSVRQSTAELPELSASMRRLADQARGQEPALTQLSHTTPDLVDQVNQLVRTSQPAVSSLLGNMVTTSQVINSRTPALREALNAVPRGAGSLASIAHGGVADFYLVAAQGPACYYDTPRRTPTDTGPRAPQLNQNCPAGPDREQRGADSAPVPGR